MDLMKSSKTVYSGPSPTLRQVQFGKSSKGKAIRRTWFHWT